MKNRGSVVSLSFIFPHPPENNHKKKTTAYCSMSAYSYKFVSTFSRAQIDLREARERKLATIDDKSTSSGIAEPYAR